MKKLHRMVKRWTAMIMALTMILQPVLTASAQTPAGGIQLPGTGTDAATASVGTRSGAVKDTEPVTITVIRHDYDGDQWGDTLTQEVQPNEETWFHLGSFQEYTFGGWKYEEQGEDPVVTAYSNVPLSAEEDKTFNFYAVEAEEIVTITTNLEGLTVTGDNKNGVTQQFEAVLDEGYSWNTGLLSAGELFARDPRFVAH